MQKDHAKRLSQFYKLTESRKQSLHVLRDIKCVTPNECMYYQKQLPQIYMIMVLSFVKHEKIHTDRNDRSGFHYKAEVPHFAVAGKGSL